MWSGHKTILDLQWAPYSLVSRLATFSVAKKGKDSFCVTENGVGLGTRLGSLSRYTDQCCFSMASHY